MPICQGFAARYHPFVAQIFQDSFFGIAMFRREADQRSEEPKCKCRPPTVGPIGNGCRSIAVFYALDFPCVWCACICDIEPWANYNPGISKQPKDCQNIASILTVRSAMLPGSIKLPTNHQPWNLRCTGSWYLSRSRHLRKQWYFDFFCLFFPNFVDNCLVPICNKFSSIRIILMHRIFLSSLCWLVCLHGGGIKTRTMKDFDYRDTFNPHLFLTSRTFRSIFY